MCSSTVKINFNVTYPKTNLLCFKFLCISCVFAQMICHMRQMGVYSQYLGIWVYSQFVYTHDTNSILCRDSPLTQWYDLQLSRNQITYFFTKLSIFCKHFLSEQLPRRYSFLRHTLVYTFVQPQTDLTPTFLTTWTYCNISR